MTVTMNRNLRRRRESRRSFTASILPLWISRPRSECAARLRPIRILSAVDACGKRAPGLQIKGLFGADVFDRRGGSIPPHAGTVNAGGARDRGFRKRADGGSPAISTECRSESNQRQSRNGWGLGSRKTIDRRNGLRVGVAAAQRPARGVMSPARSIQEYPRGVRYSSQGSLRKGRKHLGADDRSLAAFSARLAFSAGWSSPVARKAHNLEAVSSNLTPTTIFTAVVGSAPGGGQGRLA